MPIRQQKNRHDSFLGERLRQAREIIKVNQVDFSERIEIAQSHLSKIELGKTTPSPRLLDVIQMKWGISREWLETGEGQMFSGWPGSLLAPSPFPAGSGTREWGTRLKMAMDAIPIGVHGASLKIGVHPEFLEQFLENRVRVSRVFTLALEYALGIARDWIELGIGDMFVNDARAEVRIVAPGTSMTDRQVRELGAYYPVPIVAGRVAAGAGGRVLENDIEDYVPSPWNPEWCPHPTRTICVRVAGDSMEPGLPDGGLVAVDFAQRDPERLDGQIVALRTPDGDATIKRLRRHDAQNMWIAVPDNPRSQNTFVFSNDEIADAVIGKVVWVWWKQA